MTQAIQKLIPAPIFREKNNSGRTAILEIP